MHNLSLIEESYQKFIKNLDFWIPDGIFNVNLELLQHFNLLHFQPSNERKEPPLTGYFQIIESPEKITLINDQFIVWIIPDKTDLYPVTYTLIALNKGDQEPHPEAAFIASGVYNTSKLVLKILEKFILEIQENEQTLSKYRKSA